MAAAARFQQTEPNYSEEARSVMRSLWRVINNETPPEPAPAEDLFDPAALQRTLELVRQSIRAERQKVTELQRRVAALEGVEAPIKLSGNPRWN